jgi:putative ABC transport system permease protein
MRPAPPASYRPTVVERLGLQRFFDQPTRMILRNLERQPVRALLTVAGIASSCAILIMGLFFVDSIDHVVRVQYGLAQRENLSVTFIEPTSTAALHELASLPGVRLAEPTRSVPVRLRRGHRRYETQIEGLPTPSHLRRVIDTDLRPVPIPPEGIVLPDRLARILRVAPGEEVTVEVLEGRRRVQRVTVRRLTRQYLGLSATMEQDALARLTGDGPALSGAVLLTDALHEDALMQALRARPRVAGVLSQERAIAAYMDAVAETLLVFTFVLSLFAGIIAFGVIYNSVRISLSERDRELASLRVLGFTRGEIAYVLLGEMACLALLAIPLGIGIGSLGSIAYVDALQTDLYEFPAILTRRTFAIAAVIVVAAAAISAAIVRHRIHRLDLIGVLKTRE